MMPGQTSMETIQINHGSRMDSGQALGARLIRREVSVPLSKHVSVAFLSGAQAFLLD